MVKKKWKYEKKRIFGEYLCQVVGFKDISEKQILIFFSVFVMDILIITF